MLMCIKRVASEMACETHVLGRNSSCFAAPAARCALGPSRSIVIVPGRHALSGLRIPDTRHNPARSTLKVRLPAGLLH